MTPVTPLPPRDLTWHRVQAAQCDLQVLRSHLRQRLKKEDHRAAALYLAAICAQDPNPAHSLQLAQTLRRCRDDKAALAHLDTALARWPEDLALRRCEAEAAMAVHDFGRALGAWQSLIAAQKQSGPYPFLRALACLRLSDDAAGAEAFVAAHAERLRRHISRAGMQLLRKGRAGLPELAPGLYLVCGNNGTGKSTLGHFLQALGHEIIDADREIASFCLDGQFSDHRYDLIRKQPDARLQWIWPEERVTARFAQVATDRRAVFVIGGFGATVTPYLERFQHVLMLTAPDDVIANRLARRNSPGHRPGSKGFEAALKRNRRVEMPGHAGTEIASDRPVAAICAACLDAIHSASAAQGPSRSARVA